MADPQSTDPAEGPEHIRFALRDEAGNLSADFLDGVRIALEAQDRAAIADAAGDLHEADIGDLLEALRPDERTLLVRLLGERFDFTALTEVDETIRLQILESLSTGDIVRGIAALDSDDAVYILEDLDEADKAAILARLAMPDRIALQRSLDYPEESAGRRMQTDFVAVPPFWTVGQTIDALRGQESLPDEFYEIFVVDPGFRVLGTVPLSRLVRTKRPVMIGDIISDTVQRVEATQDQEEVARLFERYNLVSVAVVDEAERLVGVLTVDDIVDVIQQEAEEDFRALAGVGDEELSDSFLATARGRFPWLLINLGTAFMAASVIGLFDGTIEQMVALAILMPIVASLGGNAGAQAMTVTVRALATREIGSRRQMARIIGRECLVGLLNGATLAVLLGIIAGFWFDSPDLGVVIATALVINMLTAGTFGTMVPLVLNKLKADPAVASAVFVTTITDVVGFFAFLGLAAWWFGII